MLILDYVERSNNASCPFFWGPKFGEDWFVCSHSRTGGGQLYLSPSVTGQTTCLKGHFIFHCLKSYMPFVVSSTFIGDAPIFLGLFAHIFPDVVCDIFHDSQAACLSFV